MSSASPSASRPARGRATLRDVARVVGVSVATVSNAYNRPDQLSDDLRERVLAAAKDLGYQGPNPLARSLRRGKTGVIGLVYDAPLEYAFADPAAIVFLGSLSRTLQAADLNLLLLSAPTDPGPVREASVDGLVVYCAAQGSPLLAAVLERRLPTVLVDQEAQAGAVQVGIEDAGGAKQAAEHLRELGHQHIGVICLEVGPERRSGPVSAQREAGATYPTTAQRLRGYRQVAGVTLYPYETASNLPAEGEAAALALLQSHPHITALLCMSDVLAQGAYQAAAALERQIPADLSVVGYDDIPLSAALGLTTVQQPTAEKGQQAGELLLALLSGKSPAPAPRLPTRLVLRDSTGRVEG